MQKVNNHIPWVEKYRPSNFNDIVLSDINKTIFENILKDNYFPNLLFFGPPGTGKTTTIINLINAYQEKNNEKKKGLMIHLNASDERGIDIVRNNINNFVNSKNLFNKGTKFIILDEVDYMTKNAQQALKYLLEINNGNVRFCLICNYISRIDESLQNQFMRLRFNQLPSQEIIKFLENINNEEKLNFSREELESIQKLYQSDIRSMINYLQSNQLNYNNKRIINDEIWEKLINKIKINNDLIYFRKELLEISENFELEIKNIIKSFLQYIILNYQITTNFLSEIEMLVHQTDSNSTYSISYFFYCLKNFFNEN
jgi:replication factor C subunit 3/5